MSSKIKPVTKEQVLYNPTYMRYLEQSKSWKGRMVVASGWGMGKWEGMFNGYRVSVLQDEKF